MDFALVQTGPVGTNYARVIPSKEINSKDRDSFWKREEEEERHRIDLDRERRDQELKKQELERRQREEIEHKERERRIIEANNDTNQTNGNKAYAPVVKRFETNSVALDFRCRFHLISLQLFIGLFYTL